MKYPENESPVLEFKREIPKNDQIIKTIIGFCNQSGGRLIIGVDDDGTVIGLDQDKALELMEWVEKAVFEASSPPIIPNVLIQRLADKLVLVIKVSAGMNKPYYRTVEGLEKGTYVRIGRSTVRATSDLIEELKWQSRGQCYDHMPVYHATRDDLDEEKIFDFLKSRKQNAGSSISGEVLKSYKLIKEEHSSIYPTVAGLLLFGKSVDYWFSEAMIICTHFSGTGGREAIATRDCTGPLFEQFHGAFDFIISRLNRSFTIKGPKRDEVLEIPSIAIRELLLNAIIHRNYHLRSPSKVAIYEDRIEIFSPGSFPTPLPNLHLGLTDVRNMAICRVFREAKYIEKLGSGFITVFDSYMKRGLPSPEIIDGENFVKCILPREKYGEGEVENEHRQILYLFNTVTELAVSDVINALKIPRSTASRRLSELVNMGKLKKMGRGKGTRYFL